MTNETPDRCYSLDRILPVPLVVVHSLPGAVNIDADGDMATLTIPETETLIEQLRMAIDQAKRLRYVEENDQGYEVVRVVEDEEEQK